MEVKVSIMAKNKILVGVDGSEHNKLVIDKAAEFAKNEETEMFLVHAITPHALSEQELVYAQERCGSEFSRRLLDSGLPPFPIEENDERRSVYQYMQAREAFNQVYADDVLKRAQDQLRERGIVNIKTIIENDEPSNAILKTAELEDVDLIIIGRGNHNILTDFFLGSTAQKVLQKTKRTVLTVT